MFILLSHIITEDTPSYMNSGKITITPVKQIKKGDSSNSYVFTMYNHLGTHVDCPKHFIEEGKSVCDIPLNDFIFEKVNIIEIKKDKGELFYKKDLENFHDIFKRSDFVIFKTGFQMYREKEPMVYMFEGPGFSAEAAEYLTNYNLKGIGFDFISLSSPLHREEGRKAHKILLSKGILIVEDMNLANLPKEIKRLFVIPIYIKGLDSATCTAFAEVTSYLPK